MRKKNNSSFGVLFVLALIITGGIYLYNSELFERDMPKITLDNNGFWNLKKSLNLTIEDKSGIKSYKVILQSSIGEKTLYLEQPLILQSSINIEIKPPKSAYAMKDKIVKIIVEANDASKWNFLNGNNSVKEFELKVDKRRPEVVTIANSIRIVRGGSAIVIFKASDENLKDIYIQTNFKKRFKVQPFYKKGYYISLLAWPVNNKDFRATAVATDYASNVSKSYIPLYLKSKEYKISRIKISDKFLNGKIAELAEEFLETQGVEDPIEQFKIINEVVRARNEDLIHEITSFVPDTLIKDFKMRKMYPLKSAQVVATFGDHRKYLYKGKYISESYHLGVDLASFAMAKIIPQNSAEIVYSDFNGLYGNMPILHHGLGLYTLYGHCSSVNVNIGDSFKAKRTMARTGKSGYAMGDHLHFGVLIQGIEVRPAEWMSASWIKSNITDVIKSAKKIIND